MFHISYPEAIKRGRTTDIYFTRAKEVLESKGIKKNVTAEVTCGSLLGGYPKVRSSLKCQRRKISENTY